MNTYICMYLHIYTILFMYTDMHVFVYYTHLSGDGLRYEKKFDHSNHHCCSKKKRVSNRQAT